MLFSLVALIGAAPGDDDRAPDLGDRQRLRVPTGNRLYFHAFGVGVQIYRWNGSSWDFVAPEAVSHAHDGIQGVAGIHFGGPTWVSVSGSKVVGTVIDHCTPDPDAIPWLLLKASPEGPGIFESATYLQRLHTVGGIAPGERGDFLGQLARVPYTADYLFYRRSDR